MVHDGEGWKSMKIFNGGKKPDVRWDVYQSKAHVGSHGVRGCVTIYFSKFLDSYGAVEMFDAFRTYGEPVEIIIPPERNKFGKRFAFARFIGVEDSKKLVICLNNIFLGNKIYANLPRFQRNFSSVKVQRDSNRDDSPNNKPFRDFSSNSDGFTSREGKRTFVEVLRTDREAKVVAKRKEAYVGKVVIPGSSYNIHTHFEAEGYFSIKVTPLGANFCLLEEMEEGEIHGLIREGESWWNQWFTEIMKWKETDVDHERVTWIRVFGIPCHA
ncbi:unnamed protein product [Lathyrus sativus]|nr:unnamed protein product [Lathyrus sativus]